jgi:hypothetical protein
MERIMANDATELNRLQSFIQEQVSFEDSVKEKSQNIKEKTPYPDPDTECKPPR